MKKILIILLFLFSCTQNSVKNDFVFNENMDFDEFKNKLKEYAVKNPYPNINN
tara:strand:+ start:400 stop:558 length:159 start_codon:yes stop_codon:yes gene_type:complete